MCFHRIKLDVQRILKRNNKSAYKFHFKNLSFDNLQITTRSNDGRPFIFCVFQRRHIPLKYLVSRYVPVFELSQRHLRFPNLAKFSQDIFSYNVVHIISYTVTCRTKRTLSTLITSRSDGEFKMTINSTRLCLSLLFLFFFTLLTVSPRHTLR